MESRNEKREGERGDEGRLNTRCVTKERVQGREAGLETHAGSQAQCCHQPSSTWEIDATKTQAGQDCKVSPLPPDSQSTPSALHHGSLCLPPLPTGRYPHTQINALVHNRAIQENSMQNNISKYMKKKCTVRKPNLEPDIK